MKPLNGAMVLVLAAALWSTGAMTTAAKTPVDQLAALARHIDTAIAYLNQGNLNAAQGYYRTFDDGWFNIEDGVRAASRDSYRTIEAAMRAAQRALAADPFDRPAALAALQDLRAQCDAFISAQTSGASASPAETTPASSPGALASALRYLVRAQAAIAAGNASVAAREVEAFERQWPDVEGLVKVKSATVYADTENNMEKARALLTQSSPDPAKASNLLLRMQTDLAPFAEELHYGIFDAAIILLREGMEALLVIGALFAFLKRTGNGDKANWIWAGGGAAVLASVVVAVGINLVFSTAVAGTNREILEGITGLIATAMLLYMSFWMHSKANMGAWHKYISGTMSSALARNSLFSLAAVAFLAVFREGAETILFYLGIAPSISTANLVIGVGLATAGLATIGACIFLLGVRISVGLFFRVASVLLYYLAFKFLGTGIHALQITGKLPASPSDLLPAFDFFGLYPTWQTTLAQALLLAVAVGFVLYTRRHTTMQRATVPA